MADEGLPLDRWANFYVITSAAAATLLGLLFVVITLAADRLAASETKKIRLYMTPTAVYFAAVLCVAAMMTFPTQSRISATICCCAAGAAGIAYALSTFLGSRRGNRFRARGDVVVYVVLPALAFSLFIAGGALLPAAPDGGLTALAAGMLALVLLALRNSWALAVQIVSWRSDNDAGADPDSRLPP